MADYTAPFHAPKFTDEESEAMKEEYVKKHGYTVTLPGWKDIIHITSFKPLNDYETKLWKARRYDMFTPERRAEIQAEKKRKKEKFLAMLGDPSPEIARNAAAVLTAIDDVQDAVSTLACVGMIAAAVIGGPVAAAVLGPLGLILGASTLLNIINPMSHFNKLIKKKKTGRQWKKHAEKFTDKNPFSQKAKLKVVNKLKKFKPTLGNLLEALQVTENIYGIGISLGPIMGFAQGAISGAIRQASGQKVRWKADYPTRYKRESIASNALRAVAVLNGVQWHSDVNDETLAILAGHLALQQLFIPFQEWNPLDHFEDLESYVVECPQATDILTREILEEEGIDPDSAAVWPQNGQRWISLGELQEATADQATANLRHYAEKNPHSETTWMTAAAADDTALNFLSMMEGEENVVIDYLPTERIIIIILDNNWVYPDDITIWQIRKFEDWCYVHEYMNTYPSGKDIFNYAQQFCGFTWYKSPDAIR